MLLRNVRYCLPDIMLTSKPHEHNMGLHRSDNPKVCTSVCVCVCVCACALIISDVKGKGEDHPRTGHEDPEGVQRYSSTLSLTLALDGVDGQRHAPASLPSGKTRYPLYSRLGGPQGRSGRLRKNLAPQGDSIPGLSSP
jgi:hypothetical protein